MTKNAKDILNQMEAAVQAMADGINAPRATADGTLEAREPQAAIGPKIFADRMAGSIYETLHGRVEIVYGKDRKPSRKADGSVETRKRDGQLVYRDNAVQKAHDAFEKDPECASPWTETAARIAHEQTEFCAALDKMLAYFTNLYIEACAGTETSWRPYIERQVADLNSASGPAIEVDAETKARREAVKAQIEALTKKAS